jgi:signal peptidase II
MRPFLWGLPATALVVAADQAAKSAILDHFADHPEAGPIALTPWLNLVLTHNRGITFGFFNGEPGIGAFLFTILALVIVVVLLIWLRQVRHWWAAIAIGAVIGGAIGNVIDRVRLGAVVDFIDFTLPAWNWHWYTFNLADAAICCGVTVLLLDGLLVRPESPKEASS